MKPSRASRKRPRELGFSGARTRPSSKAQINPVRGNVADISRLLARCSTNLTRSQFVTAAQYINALKKDPWLAIGMMRLTRMLMIGDWQIIDLNSKEPLDKTAADPAPVVKLFKQPNPFRNWTMWINRLMIHWAIMGDAFMVEQLPSISGAPTELWLLEPDKVEPIASKTDFLAGYKYRAGGCEITLSREQVHQIMWQAHPTDPFRGMGIVEMGETHFNISTSIEEWIWGLFANGAIPDGVITSPDEIDPEELESYYTQFEERHRGSARSHNPLILQGGTQYVAGGAPKETDFTQAKEDRSTTSLAFTGTPPIRAGKTKDLNFASAFISDATFIEDTYVPVIRMLEDFFEPITRKFGAFRWQGADRKPITDPVEERTSVVGMVNAGLISPNEGRVLLGMEAKQDEEALDQHYMLINNIPVTGAQAQAPAGAPEAPAAPAAPPAEETPPAEGMNHLSAPEHSEKRRRQPTTRQKRFARFLLRERRQLERALERTSRAFFNWQMRQIINRLLSGKDIKGAEDAIDLASDAARWQTVTQRFFSAALREEYDAVITFSGQAALPGVFAPGRQAFDRSLTGLMNGVTRVTETTRDQLAKVLEEGFNRGLSPTQIAQGTEDFAGIRDRFRGFAAHRSQLIARTESDRLITQATANAYVDMGVQLVDIIGCEDNIILPGQKYGCNSEGIPARELGSVVFHPNHQGVPVARLPSRRSILRIPPIRDWSSPVENGVLRYVLEVEKELLTAVVAS